MRFVQVFFALFVVASVSQPEDIQAIDPAASSTFAFGNSSTDICAYADAGIQPENTFIIGDNAGHACSGFAASQPIDSYPAHLLTLP